MKMDNQSEKLPRAPSPLPSISKGRPLGEFLGLKLRRVQ